MKWIYRIMTVGLLAGALAIPFFIKNKDGDPMLSVPTIDDIVPSGEDIKGFKNDPGRLMGERTVFKWQDENGQWHYGDAPPDTVTNVSTITVDSQTNILPSYKIEEKQETKTTGPSVPSVSALPKTTGDVLSVENALNIIDNAQGARALMEQRGEQLRQIVGDE